VHGILAADQKMVSPHCPSRMDPVLALRQE